MDVRVGVEFTHISMLDLNWKPAPGQRYVDGPKARMVITRATQDTVYYRYAVGGARRSFRMPRGAFEATYKEQAPAKAG